MKVSRRYVGITGVILICKVPSRGAESELESESESHGVVAMSKESESESIKLPRLPTPERFV